MAIIGECSSCGKPATRKYFSTTYCKVCYRKHAFGCENIIDFLKKNTIRYMESAIIDKETGKGHVIINNKNLSVLEFCIEFRLDYWFSSIMVNGEMKEYMHIDT